MSSSSSKDIYTGDITTREDSLRAEENLFGPPFAYYKQKKSSISLNLVVAGIFFTIVAGLDFLLATNIIIYVRSVDLYSTKEIFIHTFVILLSLFLIWASYRFLGWYVRKFNIKNTIKSNKLYQKIASEVIELETLLTSDDREESKHHD